MDEKMKTGGRRLVFISRSDLRGGAAIVTFRLVEALRRMGHDARMLVCEKLSDAAFVETCASKTAIRIPFLRERLKVYIDNGRNRDTLFKIDPALYGLPLWRHPLVEQADAIFLGWVNQGMLSLKGVREICRLGRPTVWIMHDMWNMTGICHHAAGCTGFLHQCGDCPLLGAKADGNDMSHATWIEKENTYRADNLKFVAVSSWLAGKAGESVLMRDLDVTVIPNVFETDDQEPESRASDTLPDDPVRIIFGGARLDDPIKGLPVLKKALRIIHERHPDIADDLEILTFGEFKNPESAEGFAIRHNHLGVLRGRDALRRAYSKCGIVVSTSDYETLPGTLVEGQAYGCIPVATDHGGQRDIIDHGVTGWLCRWNDSPAIRAESIAEGLVWAYGICRSPQIDAVRRRMKESVAERFSAGQVTRRILDIISETRT